MLYRRRPWQEELAIVDRVMRAVSDITDPEEMVSTYWQGISELAPVEHYIALSRRNVAAPEYIITRSSRFVEDLNPWLHRDRLPRLSGGLLGEIAYADCPVVIDDIPARLAADDPGRFYLDGLQSLVAFPQYENGKGVNISISLFEPGVEIDRTFIPMMHWQSSLFGRGTHSLVLRTQLTAALRELDRELEIVGEIQRTLLPPHVPTIPGFELATAYETSSRAGGDYYDFFPIGEHGWGLLIADVSGHGTPAAVLMAVTHAIAHTRPGDPLPAGSLLTYLNDHLTRAYTKSGTFVTAFYATLDPVRRILSYASAGHNPPRVVRRQQVLDLDEGGGLPLGLFPGERYTDASVQLERGDLVALYTDGITEAMAPAITAAGRSATRELFGVERLDAVLLACAGASPSECVRRVEAAVAEFTRGAPPNDDRTLIIMRCA